MADERPKLPPDHPMGEEAELARAERELARAERGEPSPIAEAVEAAKALVE